MKEVLLVTGDDPRRRFRFVRTPLESVGIGCEVVEDRGRGLSPCPELRKMIGSRSWSAIMIFGADIRVGLRIAESRRFSDAPVALRLGGDPFANRRTRSVEWLKRGRWVTAARSMAGSWRTRRAIRGVDGLVAVGPSLLETLRSVAGPGVHGVVARPVVELPEVERRADLGDDGRIRVLTISNFSYRAKSRGIDVIADALREAAADLGIAVRLDVLGGGIHEEEVRSRWEGVHGALEVACHGKVADIRPHLGSADVFAYCSTLDAYGLAILEAQACGLPVMVNSHRDFRDFLVDGDDALFFAADSPCEVRDVAGKLLGSQELRRRIGDRGRSSAHRRNDAASVGADLAAFLEDLQTGPAS